MIFFLVFQSGQKKKKTKKNKKQSNPGKYCETGTFDYQSQVQCSHGYNKLVVIISGIFVNISYKIHFTTMLM